MPLLRAVIRAGDRQPFDFQVEGLIAMARVALAVFALLAIFLDPSEPLEYIAATNATLAGYLVLALVVALVVISGHAPRHWLLPMHAVDIGIISVLMYFSHGPSSPFFAFYTFVLLAATLRWNWRGAVWTTMALVIMLAVLVVQTAPAFDQILNDKHFELNRTIIRLTFLLVAGGMLAYFGFLRENSRNRLSKLAAWPQLTLNPLVSDDRPRLNATLAHVAAVMGVARILVTWQQPEEPYQNTIFWENGRASADRHLDNTTKDNAGPEHAGASFTPPAVPSKQDGSRTSQASPLDQSLMERFQVGGFISAPFSGAICQGRIFILDQFKAHEYNLRLTEIVASRVGMELEQHLLHSQVEEITAARERMRIARDLHDSVLQNLTAIGFQIKAAMSHADDEMQGRLNNLNHIIAAEQHRIRHFIEQQQPCIAQPDMTLDAVTQKLLSGLNRLWDCEIDVVATPKDARISRQLTHQLDFILSESIANAVNHGLASHIDVKIEASSKQLLLEIQDNGSGLKGLSGRYDDSQLAALNIGPISLLNRTTGLNGSLVLLSSREGTNLQISLPL